MSILKGELQADNGDILYPHTSSDVVFTSDGKNVTKEIEDVKASVVSLSTNGYTVRTLPSSKNIDDFKEVGYVSLNDTSNLTGAFPHPSKTSFSWSKLLFDGVAQWLEASNKTPSDPTTVGKLYRRQYYSVQGSWGEWKEIANTTKTDITFPGAGGVISEGLTLVRKYDSLNQVFISVDTLKPISGNFSISHYTGYTIGTLPVGFRPSFPVQVSIPVSMANNARGNVLLYIPNTGEVQIFALTSQVMEIVNLSFSIAFTIGV